MLLVDLGWEWVCVSAGDGLVNTTTNFAIGLDFAHLFVINSPMLVFLAGQLNPGAKSKPRFFRQINSAIKVYVFLITLTLIEHLHLLLYITNVQLHWF